MSPTMVNSSPISIPAPTPCKPRNRINWPIPSIGRMVSFPAAPQSADVSTNSVAPRRKNGLRPWMSDRFAKIGTETVELSK